jgi:hypothetical protein
MLGSKSSENSPRVDTYSCLRCDTVVSLSPPPPKKP